MLWNAKVGTYVKMTYGNEKGLKLFKIIEIESKVEVIVEEVDAAYLPLNKGKRYKISPSFLTEEKDPDNWKENTKEIREIEKAEKYLRSPFAKKWLKEMRYTVKEDEYGHRAVFLSILPGYQKISNESFQKLCSAICWVNFYDKLRMTMWIGGKVDWTMFYQRPDHVNGQETYFCGVVGEDNFSPEDWEKDHSEYSFEYIRY